MTKHSFDFMTLEQEREAYRALLKENDALRAELTEKNRWLLLLAKMASDDPRDYAQLAAWEARRLRCDRTAHYAAPHAERCDCGKYTRAELTRGHPDQSTVELLETTIQSLRITINSLRAENFSLRTENFALLAKVADLEAAAETP